MERASAPAWLLLLFPLVLAAPASAVDLSQCIKFAVDADGAARLTNACSDRLNLSYCIDNPASAKVCTKEPLAVITLSPGGVEAIPGYTAAGAGPVYWAVCAYPQAPIKWKPGPDSAFICRKTCVMC